MVATFVAISSAVVWACQVPVFRYALERWESDFYTLTVTPGASGMLSTSEEAAVSFLSDMAASELPANVFVSISEESNGGNPAASMALYYPQTFGGFQQAPIWTGPVTIENVRKIVDSPARREITKQILSGKSAVWVLLKPDGSADSDSPDPTAGTSENLPSSG